MHYLGITYVVLIVVSAFQMVTFHNQNVYPADQAKEWLWRARATNDLADMAKYLGKAELLLQSYRGNPIWIFPTPDTDYDLIRGNIREVIANCEAWGGGSQKDFAYQQAVHNLQETIVEIAEHLSLANGMIGANPYINPAGFFLLVCWLIAWLPIIILEERRGRREEVKWFEG